MKITIPAKQYKELLASASAAGIKPRSPETRTIIEPGKITLHNGECFLSLLVGEYHEGLRVTLHGLPPKVTGKGAVEIIAEDDGVTVSWVDGVPRSETMALAETGSFAETPNKWQESLGIWAALAECAPHTDKDATRFTLRGIQIRNGSLAATDARTLIIRQVDVAPPESKDSADNPQWPIVPAQKIIGRKSLPISEIAFSGNMVHFRGGEWELSMRCLEGRFPRADDVLIEDFSAHIDISAKQAAELAKLLRKLPTTETAGPRRLVYAVAYGGYPLQIVNVESRVVVSVGDCDGSAWVYINADLLARVLDSGAGRLSIRDEFTQAQYATESSKLALMCTSSGEKEPPVTDGFTTINP